MNLTRIFSREIGGKAINFSVTYDPTTHTFEVEEQGRGSYTLIYHMNNRQWTTNGDIQPSVSVDQLALWVQESFGIFV